MLFNSYIFILFFLPLVVIGYFSCRKIGDIGIMLSRWWLVAASLFFYGYWDYRYLTLIIFSIGINYFISWLIVKVSSSKMILVLGVIFNLCLIGYYKYSAFVVQNINNLTDCEFAIHGIVLPLAISFYTFQQIAYLVDCYRGLQTGKGFVSYLLFVTFFPQLIAGPIVHHSEMMPQFDKQTNSNIPWDFISKGGYIFAIGLFKKTVIADSFSPWVAAGFGSAENLTFIDSWTLSLSYAFQLYFDFSGYSDMAIGAALMLGIKLPWNFNSPYKAVSIQDFWRRWHMTLSRFLRDYVYIPLGGNQSKESRVRVNLLITFLLGGIWHGAGWTFLIWGLIHGVGCVVQRTSRRIGIRIHRLAAWLLTFLFVNIAWIFFRAEDAQTAWRILRAMFGFEGVGFPVKALRKFDFLSHLGHAQDGFMPGIVDKYAGVMWILIILIVALFFPNSMEIAKHFKPKMKHAVLASLLFVTSLIHLDRLSEFLYFQF